MTPFQWDESMSVGDPMLDREHKVLVNLINKVLEISAGPDRDVEIMHALTDMYLYAKEHFFDEEGLMQRLDYPDRERHIGLHRAFVEKAQALTDDCLDGTLDFQEFADYLMHWLKRHIAEEDLKIVIFAQSQAEADTEEGLDNDDDDETESDTDNTGGCTV
ncbi:MAG TPA: hemerythrin family protein [Humidesulfovibrio sp.]|uniref:bacteriohemerythrin n=1 Tax=Humidesulfovibrio sp. TaxID=2910988 RepID=UPI002B75A7AA|nr:hemerythrin family protein [Humidesulfovibrio sp.]HWR04711.1 hemerythrin family protein [Humidesulfovibrio sp.]